MRQQGWAQLELTAKQFQDWERWRWAITADQGWRIVMLEPWWP